MALEKRPFCKMGDRKDKILLFYVFLYTADGGAFQTGGFAAGVKTVGTSVGRILT